MIPISLVTAAFEFATEALRTFNALDAEQRKEIMRRLLDDDAARRKWWADAQAFFGSLVLKLKS
jgi:hypothetical protein